MLRKTMLLALLFAGSLAQAQQKSSRDTIPTRDSALVEELKENVLDNIPVISLDENDLGDGGTQNISSVLTAGRDPFYSAASFNFSAVRFRIRGYDNPKYFKPEQSDKLFVQLPGGSKDASFTRDVLWVKGSLDGETIHLYVNHWPSRVGGEERSRPARAAAAAVCKKHIDSIMKTDPKAKIVLMGDLNDDPINESVAVVLGAKGNASEVVKGGLFNPWMELYKSGIGTLAYQDSWNLFDQIIISQPWLDRKQDGFFFYTQRIFNKDFMTENLGRWKGYPMRTWDGNSYRGGYSDHFPTYIVLLKKDRLEKYRVPGTWYS